MYPKVVRKVIKLNFGTILGANKEKKGEDIWEYGKGEIKNIKHQLSHSFLSFSRIE